MFAASIFAIALSIVAFGFSLYTLWVVRVSPYRLLVYPPALSYLNRKESSLVLDMTFFNPGRVRVAVLDMEITLWSKGKPLHVGRLGPQAYHQTLFPQAGVSGRHSIISRFTPFLINKEETLSKTIYFSAKAGRDHLKEEWNAAEVDSIRIAFKVNNRWNRKTFSLDYTALQACQREKQTSSLLGAPFSTSLFPVTEPLDLRGSIFDPVY